MAQSDQNPASATERVRSLINGYQVAQALHVVATLGIADLLKDRPMGSRELAETTSTDQRALYRLLRAVASVGVLEEHEGGTFELTGLGETLRSDAPNSLAGWAAFIGRPAYWEAWGHLLQSVRTGGSAFEALHGGQTVWEWRAGNPEESQIFDRAMVSLSGAVVEQAVSRYDFGRYRKIVDVGGGKGHFIAAILTRFAGTTGIVFDLPHVAAGAQALLDAAGVGSRCEVVGGSFFDGVPAAADAYALKSVLHDWDDDSAVRILQQVRSACPIDGRLLVVERILDAPNEGSAGKFSDLNMLVAPGGQERTLEEWGSLFHSGGFALTGSLPIGGGWHVIEGTPR